MKEDVKKSSKKTTGALELVILRNNFYRDSYERMLLAVVLFIGINVLLGFSLFYKIISPPEPQYFAASSDGRIINWQPLNAPVVTDAFVEQWTANAVQQAFNLDWVHWRNQLQNASNKFTPLGWKYFIQAMNQSNNLNTLTTLKMVSDAQLTGAPEVIRKEVLTSGVYAWAVKMPVLVTFANDSRSIPVPMDVTVVVLRVPIEQDASGDGIAINNFLPEPTQTQT